MVCGNKISNQNKIMVSFRNLDLYNSKLSLQEICWFVAGNCLSWKLMEHTNDHSPDASIIRTLQNNFYN